MIHVNFPLSRRGQTSDLANQTLPPRSGNPLGTDAYGFDVLGRLMLGGQSSLEVGLASAFLATLFGSLWGLSPGMPAAWSTRR